MDSVASNGSVKYLAHSDHIIIDGKIYHEYWHSDKVSRVKPQYELLVSKTKSSLSVLS